MPDSNPALRQKLQLIAGGDASNVAGHPEAIAELLRESIPHSIRLAPPDLIPKLPLDRYNCFEFAFGLAGNPSVVEISTSLPSH